MKPFAASILSMLILATPAVAGQYVFTTIDVPGATSTLGAFGINNAGQIVGEYMAGGKVHGFLDIGGTSITLDVTGDKFAGAFGINASGQIVGQYQDASNGVHGFLLSGGSYTAIDDPSAVYGTSANGINASGQIVGNYADSNDSQHGFTLIGGTYTTLDDPNATRGTMASGINGIGQIVGSYGIGSVNHGFLLSGGVYTTLDVPGASSTLATGINDAGQIVGSYTDANGAIHGFLASSVPEPSTLTLAGLGILVLSGWTWRARRPAKGR
jgi:probable HAF family extracellular repeat protein